MPETLSQPILLVEDSPEDFETTERAFRKSIQYSPKDPLGYNNLGSVLNEEKRWDEAVTVLARALDLNPELAIARNNLAWAQSRKAMEGKVGK